MSEQQADYIGEYVELLSNTPQDLFDVKGLLMGLYGLSSKASDKVLKIWNSRKEVV